MLPNQSPTSGIGLRPSFFPSCIHTETHIHSNPSYTSGHWSGCVCVQLVCSQTALWKVSLKTISFTKRNGKEGKEINNLIFQLFFNCPLPFPNCSSVPHNNKMGWQRWMPWGTWTGREAVAPRSDSRNPRAGNKNN